MKKKDKKKIRAIEARLGIKFSKQQRKFIVAHECYHDAMLMYLQAADDQPTPDLPMAKIPLAHNAFAPEELAIPDAPKPLTLVKKRSTHPNPRGFVFDILDGLHARGTPISGRPVIDRAVANGITENTARSLVHIWRKQRGLSKPLRPSVKP